MAGETKFGISREDGTRFDARLDRHLRESGVTMQFLGRDMMRAYVNNIERLTFPENKKQGVAAIDKDLNKVFAVLDNPDALAFFNAQFGDGSAAKSGKLKGKKKQASVKRIIPGVVFNWQGNMGQMKGWHNKFRKAGKVRKSSNVVARYGKWKFGDEMYVPRNVFNRYRRMVLASVGKYKGGWGAAIEYFARITGGAKVFPAFAKKHKGGEYTDGFTQDGNGFATATNKVGYADKLTRYVLQRAQMRTEAYTQKATKKQIEKIVERFNNLRTV